MNLLVVDAPVQQAEIQGERKDIHREDEFIQLYAYNLLSEDIVVHVDLDLAFYRPLDDLFDALLFDQNSQTGIAARRSIHLERPELGIPDQIDAFWTNDWSQVAPGKRPAGYQAGFLVARRDPAVLEEMLEVIREGNYTDGMQGKVVVASEAVVVVALCLDRALMIILHIPPPRRGTHEGFVAYFYDQIRPGTTVELNQCRYNHRGMDVRDRHHLNLRQDLPGVVGGCRNGTGEPCEDCRVTDPKVRIESFPSRSSLFFTAH
jgi:hypothetical protein